MTITLIFTPAQLPALISGEQLLAYASKAYPQEQVENGGLREVAAAMDEYNHARGEYEARNAHYAQWIQWLNQNPTGQAQLLTFTTDHQKWHSAAGTALEKISAAIERAGRIAADESFRGGILQSLTLVSADAPRLAQNMAAITTATVQGADAQKTEQARAPKVLPQKRPRGGNAQTPAAAAPSQSAPVDTREAVPGGAASSR